MGGNIADQSSSGGINYLRWNSSGDGYLNVIPGGTIYGMMAGGTGGAGMSWGGEGRKAAFEFVVPSGVNRIHVSVGGGGAGYSNNATAGSSATGGFNGGGASNSRNISTGHNFYPAYSREAAGGGYTALFSGNNATSPTKDQSNVLLITGGGGGDSYEAQSDHRGTGAWGGGIEEDGINAMDIAVLSTYFSIPLGGSQSSIQGDNGTTTAGGVKAGSAVYYAPYLGQDGSALQGGHGQDSDLDAGSGGGAGWFGGGGGEAGGGYSHGAGGGGSGKNQIGSNLIWNENHDANGDATTALTNRIAANTGTSYSLGGIGNSVASVYASSVAYGSGKDGYVIFYHPS
jgi:hypothetical protein